MGSIQSAVQKIMDEDRGGGANEAVGLVNSGTVLGGVVRGEEAWEKKMTVGGRESVLKRVEEGVEDLGGVRTWEIEGEKEGVGCEGRENVLSEGVRHAKAAG